MAQFLSALILKRSAHIVQNTSLCNTEENKQKSTLRSVKFYWKCYPCCLDHHLFKFL